jgi:predicted HAD superfamily Cof-like phosphohydrolase
MINEQLELVSEFQNAFEQPILNKEDVISVERRKLRLTLLFEELTELAEAYGCVSSFKDLVFDYINKDYLYNPLNDKDTNILNKKEVLDATCDLQYILCGTILENGQQNEFDPAFIDVHESNMSKLCKGMKEAALTIQDYQSKGINVTYKKISKDLIAIIRESDNKILKNINYKPVNLNKYI